MGERQKPPRMISRGLSRVETVDGFALSVGPATIQMESQDLNV